MGDGTEKKPYTRKDVLRLIKENGGKAEGLDLSGKFFEEGIKLGELNLREIILRNAHLEKAYLYDSNLEEAHLQEAHLEEATLSFALLRKANLAMAYLDGTYLVGAHLEGADLWLAKLSRDTRLWDVDWGNYILMGELNGNFTIAEENYRQLKRWYAEDGVYDIAAEFYYREMESKRKRAQEQIYTRLKEFKGWKFLHFLFTGKDFGSWVRLWIYRLTCGYGERPWQVVIWGISVLFGLALLYFFLRGVAPYTLTVQAFWSSLYYSAVSFTALGYGPWFSAGSVRPWVQGVGAAEAIIGVFMIALFLVTFTKKMTR